ncbi:hypothetical protein [Okeania sp. KiyG1]|uniref:hypothetical protein n=1 Tax=Okeania sp. KiyG1 TaxID=2720165 RepID=UPI0019C1A1F0|nr:hypothetical protein [Okeania sp. KiyG1]GGA52686.1 hypothetical protein CYANOKiyG1_72560 [Okeania sp. KiyG1]
MIDNQFNYCPIVITLPQKRSLYLGMIDNQFNYCPIVITLPQKRSLYLGMIDNQFNYCPIVITLPQKRSLYLGMIDNQFNYCPIDISKIENKVKLSKPFMYTVSQMNPTLEYISNHPLINKKNYWYYL